MMPYCQYKGCKKVADGRCELLQKWDSYNNRENSKHCQDIWLCDKHRKKIHKLLQIEEVKDVSA